MKHDLAPFRAAAASGAADVRGAARHGVANLFGVGAAAVAGFALNVVVTRSWSAPEAGLFFAATSAFVVAVAVSGLGAGVGSVYFVSRYRELGQPHRIRPVLAVAFVPVVAAGTAVGAAGWLGAPWLAGRLFEGSGGAGTVALRALALFVPAAALADAALAACRGFGQMRPLVLVDRVGRSGAQFAGIAAVAVLGVAIAPVPPLVWAAPYVPVAAVALWWLGRLVVVGADRRPAPGAVRAEIKPFWRFAGPRALAGLAQVAIQRVDIVLLAALRGLAEAALYTAATRFLAIGQLAGQALSAAVQHRLAGHLVRGDTAAARRLYQAATGWMVLLAWPFYLLVAVFAEPVLALFGPGYVAGRGVVVVLAVTMLFATACGMVDAVLNMAGRTAWTCYNSLAAVVLNVAGNVLLIPRYGTMGAATAWAAAIVLANAVPLAQLYLSLRLHPFGRGTLLAATLAVACFAAPELVARLVFHVGPAGAAVVAAAGAVVYLGAAWWLRRVLMLSLEGAT